MQAWDEAEGHLRQCHPSCWKRRKQIRAWVPKLLHSSQHSVTPGTRETEEIPKRIHCWGRPETSRRVISLSSRHFTLGSPWDYRRWLSSFQNEGEFGAIFQKTCSLPQTQKVHDAWKMGQRDAPLSSSGPGWHPFWPHGKQTTAGAWLSHQPRR